MVDSVNARPATAPPPSPAPQPASPPAAKTDLQPSQAVNSASKPETGSNAGQAAQLTGKRVDNASKNLTIDAETQSVILKKTDTDTGQVLEQYPTESTLGLRAYAREQIQQAESGLEAVA